MLSLALAATLVGFGLLVVALVTSNLPLAIACVAVCVVGLILLVIDTLRANRRGGAGAEDEPLFTIRGRESAAREEPLDAEDEGPAREHVPVDSGDVGGGESAGLGSIVSATPEPVSEVPTDPGNGELSALSGGFSAPQPGAERAPEGDGDVNDYLRSTGSFPVQSASGPRTGPQPVPQGPAQTPQRPAPSAAAESGAPETSAPQADALPETYVGRRRLAGDPTDDIVVRSSDPELPAMQFVWDDTEDDGGRSPKSDPSDD